MMTESYLLTLTGLEPVCVVDQAGLRLRETHLVMKLGLKVFTAMPGWKHFFCLVLSALTGWTDFFFFFCASSLENYALVGTNHMTKPKMTLGEAVALSLLWVIRLKTICLKVEYFQRRS